MVNRTVPACGQHHIPKEWRATTFEYNDDGISVRVPNVYAWVCPEDGEISYTPETVDQLIATVREFIEVARHARQRRPKLAEYIVSIA